MKPEHLLPPQLQGKLLGPVEVSILVPTLNEAVTVEEFVRWCREGLDSAGATGQILLVDSSTDGTPMLALAAGAEVLRVPKRGLGRAYTDAVPFIRGRFVMLGDADLTYDFRELKPWLERFRCGDEFIMGSRFSGAMEKGAMPGMHRYFGAPLTTWLLNFIHGTRFSDIHCGMRGVTLDALKRMRLRSQSWQYASEMIIKASQLRLRTQELPVRFLRDRPGRVSNLKRIGWWAPWQAGWISVQAMLTYGADLFLLWPGLVLACLGLLPGLALFNGPLIVFGIGFSLHWMLFFLLLGVAGFQALLMGILARVIYDPERHDAHLWHRHFRFNRVTLTCAVLFAVGIIATSGLIWEYADNGFRLPSELGVNSYRAVAGIALCLLASLYFTFSLVFNAVYELTAPQPQP
jgi:glycosyltransferase involved in cell wall biosynthesis